MPKFTLRRPPRTRDGDTLPPVTPVERILARLDPQRGPDECWIWPGSKSKNGYGRIRVTDGGTTLVHRRMYEEFIGPIPAGLDLDHVAARGCTSRACANPAHLEPVTRLENVHRGRKYRPAFCIRKHPYTPENTIHRKGTDWIQCRTCENEAQRRKKRRRAQVHA